MNKICFYREGLPVSEQQFCSDVAALRSAIQNTPAKKVILFHQDCYLFCVGLFALILEQRCVLLPANSQSQTLNSLVDAEATLGDFSVEKLLSIELLLPAHPLTEEISSNFLSLPEMFEKFDGIVTFYTSGSTGEPKPIVKQCRHLMAEIEAHVVGFAQGIKDVDALVCTVSHQHLYGLLFKVLLPLRASFSIVNDAFEYPEHIAQCLEQLKRFNNHKIFLISSPAHLKRLVLDNVLSTYKDMFSLTFSSGGPLAVETSALYNEQMGSAPIEVFGSTETGGIAWRQGPEIAQTPWRLFAGLTYHIEQQRLSISSPFMEQRSYLTDDLVKEVNQSQFVLCGRADRTIKIEEKRVNLNHLERSILSQEWVDEIRVISIEQQQRNILAVVAALTKSGQSELAVHGKHLFVQKIKRALQQEFEAVCIPRKWRFVETLPYNPQGKLILQDLEAMFE